MSLKNRKDHWAFLDEIEAPMWVDLTVEATRNGEIDDEWFYETHQFHQCSSRQLKLAFSRIVDEGSSSTSELDLLGESSPILPSSVSRSRGKDYRSNSSKGDLSVVTSNISQPGKVKGKPSGLFSGTVHEIKPNLRVTNFRGAFSSKASLVPEISRNVKAKLVKPISACVDPVSISSSSAEKSNGSKAGSTMTHENISKEPKSSIEVSSRTFGQTSGLLSALGISLRKSYITRQAARVEITTDKRESRGRKSSSGKSSTGSSSHPNCAVKCSSDASGKKKEHTPDSRNITSKATTNGVKVSMRSNSSDVQSCEGINGKRPTSRATSKSKVQNQTLQSKPLQQNSIASGATKAASKVGFGKINKVMAAGKENSVGRVSASQVGNRKTNATGGIDGGIKGTKPRAPWKGGGTRFASPKQGIAGQQKAGKKLTSIVHLR